MAKQGYTEESLAKLGLIKGEDGVYYKPKTVAQPREVQKFEKDKIEDVVKKQTSDKLVISWAGKDISLNAWYSSKHWTHRNKQKQEWNNFFKEILHEPYPFFEKYIITLEYNSRLDPSNTITVLKLYEDTLRELGVLVNDSLKYCKGLHIIPVESMKKKSYKITISPA